jgi:VCBS repeat-containing protein
MTVHDDIEIEQALERAFAERAASTHVSDDAEQKIAGRRARQQHRQRVARLSSAIAAALVGVVVIGSLVYARQPSTRVAVAPAQLPTLTVTRYEVPDPPKGWKEQQRTASGDCTKARVHSGQIVCDDPNVVASVSYAPGNDMNAFISVTTTTGPRPPAQEVGTGNQHAVTVRGRRGTIGANEASFNGYDLKWQEAPNVTVEMQGTKRYSEQAMLNEAARLVPHTVSASLSILTNSYSVSNNIIGVGRVDGSFPVRFGLSNENGSLCFGLVGGTCSPVDRKAPFAVLPNSTSFDDGMVQIGHISGTVRPDAATVKVKFSDGSVKTSDVGGRNLNLGMGLWAVPWDQKVQPQLATVLDGQGNELARVDLHGGMFDPTPGFTQFATRTLEGKSWRIATSSSGPACVEVQVSSDRRYFCGAFDSSVAATEFDTSFAKDTSHSAVFARLGTNAVGARIDDYQGSSHTMHIFDIPGFGRLAMGLSLANSQTVTALDGSGKAIANVAVGTNDAPIASNAKVLLHGTAAGRGWELVQGVAPLLTSPLADVQSGGHEAELCLGVGYGSPTGRSCIDRGLFDSYLSNNGGSAAASSDPPVALGVVAESVPRVRVELADGSHLDVATAPSGVWSDIRLWMTPLPPNMSVNKVESLDASGRVIGQTGQLVPLALVVPNS